MVKEGEPALPPPSAAESDHNYSVEEETAVTEPLQKSKEILQKSKEILQKSKEIKKNSKNSMKPVKNQKNSMALLIFLWIYIICIAVENQYHLADSYALSSGFKLIF